MIYLLSVFLISGRVLSWSLENSKAQWKPSMKIFCISEAGNWIVLPIWIQSSLTVCSLSVKLSIKTCYIQRSGDENCEWDDKYSRCFVQHYFTGCLHSGFNSPDIVLEEIFPKEKVDLDGESYNNEI